MGVVPKDEEEQGQWWGASLISAVLNNIQVGGDLTAISISSWFFRMCISAMKITGRSRAVLRSTSASAFSISVFRQQMLIG